MEYTVLRSGVQAESELVVQRSRFLAFAQRTETEAAAREMITQLRQRYPDARHHCSAFVLGSRREITRSNDDGEPSGTAGPPILETITGFRCPQGKTDLSDICVVVVRYFGGTLLGTGGLIRAYSEATTMVLSQEPLLHRRQFRIAELTVSVTDVGRYHHAIAQSSYPLLDTTYREDSAHLQFGVLEIPAEVAAAEAWVQQLSHGKHHLRLEDTAWVDSSY